VGEVVSTEPMGLYDENGERVVNYEKRADNMRFCGTYLEFANIGDELKLIKANFCRVPLCPMCQWRKSMRIFFGVSDIMREIEKRRLNYIPVFLTLTVKNCSLENLNKNLDIAFNGWHDFMRSNSLNPMIDGKIIHIVKGWFRALEITYNDKTNTFHPHFHAIMLVEKNYFKGKDYMKTEDWVKLWRKSAKLDYDPVCDIRRTRSVKGKRKEVAEVAKYTYKDAEILSKKLSDDNKDDVVKCLSGALHGRRLYAYGGVMKEIAAELKIKDENELDLKKDGEIDLSLAKMILSYHWNVGVSNYTLAKKIEVAEVE
jgi:plasmid rolling circle replication initiator protein Rep